MKKNRQPYIVQYNIYNSSDFTFYFIVCGNKENVV